MNNDPDAKSPSLTPEALSILSEMKKKEASGDLIDPQISEALKAIDLASKVVNTIMSGNQIDPVFFKTLSDLTMKKIEGAGEPFKKKVLQKKKKFRKVS